MRVDRHFHHGYCCCFDYFNLFEGGVVAEKGLYKLEGNSNPFPLRHVLERTKDLLVDCDVNITIFDSDAISAASEKFDWNGVVV